MKRADEFSLINKAASIAACVFLLGIFLFSHLYTDALSKYIVPLAEQAEEHVHNGNWEQADETIKIIEQRFQKAKNVLKLFYNHEDVDLLDTEVSTALQLVRVEEPAEILLSLENIKSIAIYLAGIETFSIPNLF